MITDLLITVVVKVLAPLVNTLLPHLALGTLPTVASTALTRLGALFKFFTPILPAPVILAWLTIWIAMLTAAGGYVAFEWIWSHVPTIGGFGTGDG